MRLSTIVTFALLMMLMPFASIMAKQAQTPFSLLTAEEARQLDMNEADWKALRIEKYRALPEQGPRIEIKKPTPKLEEGKSIIDMQQPADLLVAFIKNKADIDMSSLEIVASKGIFSVSLTDRLRPYIKQYSLEAKDIKIPEGNYVITISIADLQCAVTENIYRLHAF